MANYTVYVPLHDIQLEPAKAGRYYFGANNEDWIQILSNKQLHHVPLRICLSINGILIGATSFYGDGFTKDPFLLSGDALEQKRYLKISQIPASVLGTVLSYTPNKIRSDQNVKIDRPTLTTALDAIASVVGPHGLNTQQRDISGIAIQTTSVAKP